MTDEYMEQSKAAAEKWQRAIKKVLLPNYELTIHFAERLLRLCGEVVEANELYSGTISADTIHSLAVILRELDAALSSIPSELEEWSGIYVVFKPDDFRGDDRDEPGVYDIGDLAEKARRHLRIVNSQVSNPEKIQSFNSADLQAISLAIARLKRVTKGLKEISNYTGPMLVRFADSEKPLGEPQPTPTADNKNGAAPTTDDRMWGALRKDTSREDWTIEQWMAHLGVNSKSTIHKTTAWRAIMQRRKERKENLM
jgi:hypothetical protein